MKRASLSLGILLTVVLIVTIFAGCAIAPKAEAPKRKMQSSTSPCSLTLRDPTQ